MPKKKMKKVVSKTVKNNIDWKFIITLTVLVIIGLGVLKIYQGLAAQNPEAYPVFFGVRTNSKAIPRNPKDEKFQKKAAREERENNRGPARDSNPNVDGNGDGDFNNDFGCPGPNCQ